MKGSGPILAAQSRALVSAVPVCRGSIVLLFGEKQKSPEYPRFVVGYFRDELYHHQFVSEKFAVGHECRPDRHRVLWHGICPEAGRCLAQFLPTRTAVNFRKHGGPGTLFGARKHVCDHGGLHFRRLLLFLLGGVFKYHRDHRHFRFVA